MNAFSRPIDQQQTLRVGLVGTGWLSQNAVRAFARQDGVAPSRILTRRPLDGRIEHPRADLLTDSVDDLIAQSDVILECSGDPIYATDVIAKAFDAKIAVVTCNPEFHVTAGSAFVGRGLLTESAGDQPGVLALVAQEARQYGFEPLVYGNLKGFLRHDPTPEDMAFWAKRNGISVPMVTSFTDGTKLQVEQALVANGLGAGIARRGLLGPAEDSLQAAADLLCGEAERLGHPIADYVLSGKLPHGVFVAGRHDAELAPALRYLKLGEGPHYVVLRHNIFVFMEIAGTIRALSDQGRVLLDNGETPSIGVAAVAKRPLVPGDHIEQGIGSFAVRGEAVRIVDYPGHLPIGLVAQARVRRPVPAGEILSMDDVDLPDSRARACWDSIEARVLAAALAQPRSADTWTEPGAAARTSAAA